MSPNRLLRLYPRAWRERYGDEFLALVEDQSIGPRQVLDIVSAAIDARLTRAVPASATTPTPEGGGSAAMTGLKARLCENDAQFTIRDSLIGAGVILALSVASVLAKIALTNAGYEAAGEALVMFATTGGLVISMPFWLTKGQPFKAQAVVVGVPLLLLATIAVVKAVA